MRTCVLVRHSSDITVIHIQLQQAFVGDSIQIQQTSNKHPDKSCLLIVTQMKKYSTETVTLRIQITHLSGRKLRPHSLTRNTLNDDRDPNHSGNVSSLLNDRSNSSSCDSELML